MMTSSPIKQQSGSDAQSSSSNGPNRIRSLVVAVVDRRGEEPVDELGIPCRIHYWVLAMFAFAVGFAPLILGLIPSAEELRNPAVQAVCLGGIVIAPIYVLLPKRWGYEFKPWAFELVLFYAIAGPLFCEQFISDVVPSGLTIFMLGPIGAAYYLSIRHALPLIAIGTAAILYKSSGFADPDAMLRGVILAILTVGSSVMLLAVMRHLVRAVATNRAISELDPLTSTFNLHHFEARLPDEVARSERGGDGFALIQLDLDDFKSVNETFNHTVGDDVLVATAEAIQSVLTPADVLVRRGGDEFVVLAPTWPGRDIAELTKMAQVAVARARATICPTLIPLASGGYVVHRPGEPPAVTLSRADDVLHEAKVQARHRRGSATPSWTRTPSLKIAQPLDSANLAIVAEATSENHRNHLRDPVDLHDDPISGARSIAVRTAGIATLASCIAVAVMSAFGQTRFALSPATIAPAIVWALAMAPLVIWAVVRRRESQLLAHVAAIATLMMITATSIAAGETAPTIIEFYALATVIFTVLFPLKQAVGYSVVALGSYAAFLMSSDLLFADVRMILTITNISLLGAVMALTRIFTIKAAYFRARLARTDALTGLPNTRRLRDRLRHEINRCTETGESLALLMLDLDEFKSVNDQFSHTDGDRTLIAVADAIEDAVRRIDMPARRGGDEFAVLMTAAGDVEAKYAAKRIGAAIAAARAEVIPSINPSASVGWVVWHHGESVGDLIDRADHALHEVKAESRRTRVPEAVAVG